MKVVPDIPLTNFSPDSILSNTVQHWGFFTAEEIRSAASEESLLMIDLDFGRKCSLTCPGCFRRDNPVDQDGLRDLDYDEILDVVDQACALGLRSIKLCGAGEPFENPSLLRFASDLTQRHIGLAIFTKGHVLGDDAWVARLFGPEVRDGLTFSHMLFTLKTSIMLSYPSFDGKLLSSLVGDRLRMYPQRLRQAAKILADTGFNQIQPTRMAFVHAPITKQSINDAFGVYRFARERNILPVLAFLMISGRQINRSFLHRYDPTPQQKLRLFRLVYEYNLAKGLNTQEQLAKEGISCMPGIHPCNQIAVGLYITANGNVLRCPGDYNPPLGNVRHEKFAEIWKRCRDWRFKGQFNCGCPFKDGITIPLGLYDSVSKTKAGPTFPELV